MTNEQQAALQKVVAYLWNDERKDHAGRPSDEHIFTHVDTLREYLEHEGAEVSPPTGTESITPASGRRAGLLDELLRMAKALPKLIELERSGVRDGNGYWHGSDPLHGTINKLLSDCQELAGPVNNLGTLTWIPHDGPSETFQNVEPRTRSFEFWEGDANGWTKIRYGFGQSDDEIPF